MMPIAWIKTIEPEDASGALAAAYAEAKTPAGTVDNVMKAHSLRPGTLAGHLALYRAVLHGNDIVLPLWFLETVASYVSLINDCDYALRHHFRNARALLADDGRADAVLAALRAGRPERAFDGKELALLRYAAKLTARVGDMAPADVADLRAAGADDGEILEVNQVSAYFNYSNRLLNGLGVSTQGDRIGYYD